jgi:hypothetical protein
MAKPVTVNDVLDGHVALDLECLDRIYLNAYVPNLQVGGQVVSFLTAHLGYPIPSPAIFDKIGTAFRRAVGRFAEEEHIPLVRFTKADRKIEKMRPYLAAQAKTGRSGVAAIGVTQEYANGVHRHPARGIERGAVVLLHQGRPPRELLLLLPLGRRLRTGVRQDLRLFPLPRQDLDQRP